jgi:hypothetical protein
LLLQFRNKLGPIGRERSQIARSGVGPAWSCAGDVDENDRQPSLAESARELGGAFDNLADRVHGRQTDNAFLQVNHHQRSGRIEFG